MKLLLRHSAAKLILYLILLYIITHFYLSVRIHVSGVGLGSVKWVSARIRWVHPLNPPLLRNNLRRIIKLLFFNLVRAFWVHFWQLMDLGILCLFNFLFKDQAIFLNLIEFVLHFNHNWVIFNVETGWIVETCLLRSAILPSNIILRTIIPCLTIINHTWFINGGYEILLNLSIPFHQHHTFFTEQIINFLSKFW